MIGVANTDCPRIMALGVNSKPKLPSIPCRLNSPNSKSPTTTVGIAIKLFSKMTESRLRGKSDTPIVIPIGIPISDAIMVDHPEVLTDVQTAEYTSGSAEKISDSAVLTDCANEPTQSPLIDEENRIAFDLIIRDDVLAFRTCYEVDELHGEVIFHMREFLRIHSDHAIGVEQTLLTFEHNRQVRFPMSEGVARSAIRERIRALLGCHCDHFSHALARRAVPIALWG